ncbi:MAG TPA: hypothetical protein VGG22_03905 [Candidatus Baltobacteraceae bacterium]
MTVTEIDCVWDEIVAGLRTALAVETTDLPLLAVVVPGGSWTVTAIVLLPLLGPEAPPLPPGEPVPDPPKSDFAPPPPQAANPKQTARHNAALRIPVITN